MSEHRGGYPAGDKTVDQLDPPPPAAAYVPPAVGAPTWPRAYGATVVERGDRLEIEWPTGRGMSWVAPKVIEGWVEQVNELRADRGRLRRIMHRQGTRLDWHESGDAHRDLLATLDERTAERDRLRAVIAAAYVDLLAGRVDEAIAALRAAGGQP